MIMSMEYALMAGTATDHCCSGACFVLVHYHCDLLGGYGLDGRINAIPKINPIMKQVSAMMIIIWVSIQFSFLLPGAARSLSGTLHHRVTAMK